MKERPILFSGPMVRAILEGRKTVTRRACKPQPSANAHTSSANGVPMSAWWETGKDINRCPYGEPDDRLWVRETFFAFGRWETRYSAKKGRDEWHFIDMTLETGRQYQYDSLEGQDFKPRRNSITPAWWLRPSIHMPRKASRILLEITAVRVERLQDITEEQAEAEGVQRPETITDVDVWDGAERELFNAMNQPRARFRRLWGDINGPHSWDANPWVWVVEFKRVTP